MAKRGPRRLKVTKTLSIPVWGVDSRKETVEPLLAPCLCSDIDTGMTPQEHKGRGTPKIDAFTSGQIPLPPRCLSTNCCDMRTERIPAMKKPNNRYGDISATVFQKSVIIDLAKSIIVRR